jgi:hypothetical protein
MPSLIDVSNGSNNLFKAAKQFIDPAPLDDIQEGALALI